MALFKIFKGNETNLLSGRPKAQEGFCYFCQDTGKFYIDIAGDGTSTNAVIGTNRIPINSAYADLAAISGRIPFGTCNTPATTSAKVINTTGLADELLINSSTLLPKSGTMLMVYFGTANESNSVSFTIPGVGSLVGNNINIYYSNEQAGDAEYSSWNIGSLRLFVFMTDNDTNGTNPRWVMLDNNRCAEYADRARAANLNIFTDNGIVKFHDNNGEPEFASTDITIDATNNITAPNDLTVNGDVYLNNETYAEDITTNTLLVLGDARFTLIPNAPTAAAGTSDNQLATTEFVTNAISENTGPMRYMGTIGTGGTVTSLSAAAEANKGHVYRVITAGTYGSIASKVGDLLISTGTAWLIIDSDRKVEQNAATTENYNYPILLAAGTASTATIDAVNKSSALIYNPSSKTLTNTSGTITTGTLKGSLRTNYLNRPDYYRTLNAGRDVTLQSLINRTRSNKLAFLNANLIIIEQTVDGGTTWTDAGISDEVKMSLFSEIRSQSIKMPRIDGLRNILCGLRITFTGMRYNVPANTVETEKYNYWNSTYVDSSERYFYLQDLYFYVTSSNDDMNIKVERATGADSTTWVICNSDYINCNIAGNSGYGYIRMDSPSYTFGGGKTLTTNYWNWRITIMTVGTNDPTILSTSSPTTQLQLWDIRGYGNEAWTSGNNYMRTDHLYSFDIYQNATFPANVTATKFVGPLEGNADTATSAAAFTSAQSITLTGDTTGTASSTAGWSITTKTDRLTPVGNNRNTPTTPNDYNNKLIFLGLKRNNSDTLNLSSLSSDNYSYVLGLRGWTDLSGGKAHELAFNNSGIFWRIGSTTEWESWKEIATKDYVDSSDTLVKLTAKSDNKKYKILTTASDSPISEEAAEAAYDTDITINPSTNTIYTPNIVLTDRYFHNVASFATLSTPKEILIKTKIPFVSGSLMPKIFIHMYNYSLHRPTELTLGFYIYNNAFTNPGMTSNTSFRPTTTLNTYTENNNTYVAIGIGLIGTNPMSTASGAYCIRFNIDALDLWSNTINHDAYFTNWEITSNTSDTSIIPTDNRKIIDYVDVADTALKVSKKLTIGTYEYDGSTNVTIPIYNGAYTVA